MLNVKKKIRNVSFYIISFYCFHFSLGNIGLGDIIYYIIPNIKLATTSNVLNYNILLSQCAQIM